MFLDAERGHENCMESLIKAIIHVTPINLEQKYIYRDNFFP